jgi:predicted enzyme related to lactoylglutathione lyase
MTRDPKTAKKFYEKTIGWTFEDMPMAGGSTYVVAKVGDRPVGGIFDTTGTDMANLPEHWFSYLAVDDIDARCAKAKAAGGTIVRAPFEVPGVGRIAVIRQPGGGMVGWMTPTPAS